MNQPVGLDTLARVGVIAVLRAPSADLAVQAVDALVAGGVTGIEITYTTPDATTVIHRVRERHGEQILLGAGTITTPDQAHQAADAGASFLVSPGCDPELAAHMARTGAAVMLGAMTPTEIMAASRYKPLVVKIFPASLGGPAYLRALRGPFPDVAMMPTGGVSPDNLGEWLRAGAIAVGAGSELCSAAAMTEGRWAEIEGQAKSFAAALAAARSATA